MRLLLSPPTPQIRQITANEAVCLAVIVVAIIATLYSITYDACMYYMIFTGLNLVKSAETIS